MIDFLKSYQNYIMLVLSGICAMIAIFSFITRYPTRTRKIAQIVMSLDGMVLLLSEILSDEYSGVTTPAGYWIARICNFLVFLTILLLIHSFTLYLADLIKVDLKLPVPKRLHVTSCLLIVGEILVIVSQFTGLYYTIDELNRYHRSALYPVCYIFPFLAFVLLFWVILGYRKKIRTKMWIMLLLFALVPLITAIIQYFVYGIYITDMAIIGMVVLLYVFALADTNRELEKAQKNELQLLKGEQDNLQRLFSETAIALVDAIDAKDTYTHGHSARVAEYSRKIAALSGKGEKECDEIYYAALLHDVGKIGIPDSIINKQGKLTPEEYDVIKSHSTIGYQILSEISDYTYLRIAARSHHERYDGRGYPDGLKGLEIPELARIISVADAYDAMTSNRSYRAAIPQHIVREEIVKGIGTQFDPDFAGIMLHMIDLDTEYRMHEAESGASLSPETVLYCESIYHGCSEGIAITNKETSISLCSEAKKENNEQKGLPTLIVFDSLDGKVHPGQENNKDILYFEYAQIRLDGHIVEGGIRKAEVTVSGRSSEFGKTVEPGHGYVIYAVRYKDHALIRIMDEKQTVQIILALPDNTRFTYISIGGENCLVHNIQVENSEKEIGPGDIPRIAEEVSFIKGEPQGDIPNIQVDGWRTEASEGMPIEDGLTLAFHSMSLPTARLVWHCPYISVFSSDNGQVDGGRFRECILLRLDGENWESDDYVENEVQIEKHTDFVGWNEWVERNKQGQDCTVTIRREKNRIIMDTENLGIAIHSITTIHNEVKELYVALTGDQVAITNIQVIRDLTFSQKGNYQHQRGKGLANISCCE